MTQPCVRAWMRNEMLQDLLWTDSAAANQEDKRRTLHLLHQRATLQSLHTKPHESTCKGRKHSSRNRSLKYREIPRPIFALTAPQAKMSTGCMTRMLNTYTEIQSLFPHTHTHTNTAIQSLLFLAVSSHTYSAIQLLHEHTNLHSEKDNQKYTDILHDFMCIYIYIHIPYIYIYIYQRCDRCHADCTCQRCDRCLQSMHIFHLHCFDSMFTHQTTHHSIVKHNFYHPTISAMLTCDPMMCHYDSSTH